MLIKKPDQDATNKRILQANITDEHRCKNPQQNSSKQIPTDHISWPSGLYPRDAKILQYLQINQCDTPHQQIER